PGATVKVTNEETNISAETKANAEGNYTVPFIIPGRYTVSAAAKGFRGTEQPGVMVQINDRIELNLTLQIGTATESIVVKAESPMLQTASVDLGQVADHNLLDPLLNNSTVLSL